ncbi:MAG: hypothetical protein HQK83_12140 [Fibrobacteria bacterium]|nr:hypothetical protein [Fibrobacteria bacterium]
MCLINNYRNNIKNLMISVCMLSLVLVVIPEAKALTEPDTSVYLEGQIVPHPKYPKWLVLWSKTGDHKPILLAGPGDPERYFFIPNREEMIDRMAEHGGNCIYIMADASGDADGMEAYVNGDPTQGYEPETLDEWEPLLKKMADNGIYALFFFYDDNVNYWGPVTKVPSAEERLIKQLVQRFDSLPNIMWAFAEESNEAANDRRAADFANKVREYDRHDHIMGIHTMHMTQQSSINEAAALVKTSSSINQFAVQCNVKPDDDWHKCAVDVYHAMGSDVHVNMSENTEAKRDDEWRRRMWAGALGGGAVSMQLRNKIMEAKTTELNDFRNITKFFEKTDFFMTEPHDELRNGSTRYTLAKPGEVYIGYSSTATGTMGFKQMIPGLHHLIWYNAVTNETLIQDSVDVTSSDMTWQLPTGFSGEIALYARKGIVPVAINKDLAGSSEKGLKRVQKGLFINGVDSKIDMSQVTVYDLKGKIINATNENLEKTLSNGIYFYKLNN